MSEDMFHHIIRWNVDPFHPDRLNHNFRIPLTQGTWASWMRTATSTLRTTRRI